MLNKIMLIGRLGQDPESKQLPSGEAVTNFSLATSEVWNDRASGQKQERTEWHRIVCYGRTAEVCRDYLFKGSQVYVEGSLHYRKWQDQNGAERMTPEIKCSSMQMLGSKNDSGGQHHQQQQYYQQAAAPTAPATQQRKTQYNSSYRPPQNEDDNIPF